MSTLQQAAEFIIKAIVATPDEIVITSTEIDGVLHLEVTAPAEMIGQLIGKEGRIIKSIRTILNLSFPNVKYVLDVKG
ncbi:KH domain-containing protein [Candidatus Shapirobacteria bacterium]|nr:KH domain-containing protein [Candidatus Shapirobacteria bacterium]